MRTLVVVALGATVALVPAALRSGAVGPRDQTPPPVVTVVDREYRPPVDAPVRDRFRAPTHRFGPGNRGWEYAARDGQVVRSVGPGTVTFAGPVGGTLHVTVLHPDGLRSSYSQLASVVVEAGRRLRGGEQLGTATSRFHLGFRRGDRYVDPATIFGGGRAVLVEPG